MTPNLSPGGYLAWFLVAWLLGFFLLVVPQPVLGKLLICAATVLSVAGSGVVRRAEKLLVLGASLALYFAFGKYLQQPFPSILFLTSILFVYVSMAFRKDLWKLVMINLGAAFCAFALGEIYLAGWPPFGGSGLHQRFTVVTAAGETQDGDSKADPELGYRNAPSARITETKTWQGKHIYRAVYTTDPWGWRITPIAVPATARPVIFLGCSFVFGQGVQDEQALPSAFEQESRGAYRSYNFSAPGYGPHQALRLLERGIEQEALAGGKPAAAIYVAVPDQVARSSGLKFWDQNGPRYALGDDGAALYRGRLNDGLVGRSRELLFKSGLVRRFSIYLEGSSEQEALYVAILRQAARVYHGRYGTRLYVFYWGDETAPEDSRRIARLRAAGLAVITINEVIPDYTGGGIAKYLYAHDRHPLPEAQMRVGRFLADYLLSQPASQAQ